MSHLDPVGRYVTDTLDLSRAAATRHAHVSALRKHPKIERRDRTRGHRLWMGALQLIPSRRDGGHSSKVSVTART